MFVCPIIGGEGLLSRFLFLRLPAKNTMDLQAEAGLWPCCRPPPPPHRPANTSFSGMNFGASSRLVALVTRTPRRRGSSSGWVLSGSQKPKRIFAGRENKTKIKKALQADEKSQPTKNNNLTPKPLNPEASHPRVRTHSASSARAAWCNKPRPLRSKASELYRDIEYCGSGFMKQRLGANT